MCHSIGLSPTSIIGFGFRWVSSEILVPKPPAKITAFMTSNYGQGDINIIFINFVSSKGLKLC